MAVESVAPGSPGARQLRGFRLLLDARPPHRDLVGLPLLSGDRFLGGVVDGFGGAGMGAVEVGRAADVSGAARMSGVENAPS